jgi:glycosyl-4,4'-diaponeurosporenoate acyltransferase
MSNYTDQELSRIRRLLNRYNMIPNVAWSVLNLVPLSMYCYNWVDHKSLYTSIALSIMPGFFPNSFYDRIQLGRTARTYKRLGVGFVNKLAQNGTIINGLIKKKFPDYKMITPGRSSVNKLLEQTYMFEKFHFIMFIFFILITAYALVKNDFWWSIVITVTNVLYNVYPNLLQQYIRLKLRLYKKQKPN